LGTSAGGGKTRRLTSFERLIDDILHSTFLGVVDRLRLEVGTARAHALAVHGPLQRVALPAEDVVGVLAEAGAVARR